MIKNSITFHLKWVHMPYLHVLKIYPNTDMARLAMAHGISKEAIEASDNLGYNEGNRSYPTENVEFSEEFVTQVEKNLVRLGVEF